MAEETFNPEDVKLGIEGLILGRLEDSIDPDKLEVEVALEPDCSIEVRSNYFTDLELELPSLFFEQGYFVQFPPQAEDYRVVWNWKARRKDGTVDHYLIDCALRLIPDTGGFTEAAWREFNDQFVWKINGEKRRLPEPEDFIEEYGEEEILEGEPEPI